jgi:hypothetical protein
MIDSRGTKVLHVLYSSIFLPVNLYVFPDRSDSQGSSIFPVVFQTIVTHKPQIWAEGEKKKFSANQNCCLVYYVSFCYKFFTVVCFDRLARIWSI